MQVPTQAGFRLSWIQDAFIKWILSIDDRDYVSIMYRCLETRWYNGIVSISGKAAEWTRGRI